MQTGQDGRDLGEAKQQFLGFYFLRRPPFSVFVETPALIKCKSVPQMD